MPRKLSEQVIVITGASSGIGRQTAVEAGRHAASIVLAARNETALRETARQVEEAGGQAHVLVVDVADPEQVQHLADEAVRRFGRIDTWINNAAVGAYARVEQMEPEEMRRVIEVNLLGVMYGCRAAVQQMKRQGGGVIINVGSALSDRAVPLTSAYVASKFGVRGFTDALRLEMKREHRGIHVTLILPASINTPIFAQSRSKLGVKPRPIPPVYEPKVASDAILFAAEHPQRELYAGDAGKLLATMERISPRLLDWYMLQRGRFFRHQMTNEPPGAADNLFEPVRTTGQIRGEWGGESHAASPYTRHMQASRWCKRLLIGSVAAGALLLLRRR